MNNFAAIFINPDGRIRSGWRAAVFLVAFVISALAFGTAGTYGLRFYGVELPPGSVANLISNAVFSLLPALFIGWLCGRYLEDLPYRAIGAGLTKGWLKHWFLGVIVGAITLAFAVSIGFGFGGLRFDIGGANRDSIIYSLAVSFVMFGAAAAFEEALFRGYILQTFARSGLAWLAILLTSIFFGVVHLGNPHAGVISTLNTALAGIWFSVAYLKTRDLWFVWGLHLMWNWMQGSFFGIEVSGLTEITASPLLKEIDRGPAWLTGETYGIEGGIVCTVAIIISTIAIYKLPIVRPDRELLILSSKESAIDDQAI